MGRSRLVGQVRSYRRTAGAGGMTDRGRRVDEPLFPVGHVEKMAPIDEDQPNGQAFSRAV
jgi:hypothetical protein